MDSFGRPFSLHSTGVPYRFYPCYSVAKKLTNTIRKLARSQKHASSIGYGRCGHQLNLLRRKARPIQYYEVTLCVRLLQLFPFLQNMKVIANSNPIHNVLSTYLLHKRSENLLLLAYKASLAMLKSINQPFAADVHT